MSEHPRPIVRHIHWRRTARVSLRPEDVYVDVQEFRKLVIAEFGRNLEHATPGNVREFIDGLQLNALGPTLKGRIVLEEKASTFEDVLKDFFARALELPPNDAIILLWLLALDFAFSAIELQQEDAFKSLFGEYAE